MDICTKVALRQRLLDSGKITLYFDYYPPIRNPKTNKMQRHEYLGIYLYGNPTNKVQRDFNRTMLENAIRTSFRYSSQYINSLMEHIHGWVRSEKEKVPGMHRDYCGADGRVKRPWIRTDNPKIPLSPTLDFDCKTAILTRMQYLPLQSKNILA